MKEKPVLKANSSIIVSWANILSTLRLALSVLLLAVGTFSKTFYIVYILAGLTDMLDGPIARRTHTESAFGARLDSTADFIFVIVCLIKLLPAMNIEKWLWTWIIIIAVVKFSNIISSYVMTGKIELLHTKANKLTGLLLFMLPLTLQLIELKYSANAVCIVALYAAVEEGHLIRTTAKN